MTTIFCLKLILATVPDNGNSASPRIVSENNIKLMFEIQKKVDAIRANYSGSMVSLQDICMKPLDKDCATQSVLQAFAFVVTYPVNNVVDKEGNGTRKAVAWEKSFIQLVKDELLPMEQSRNLTLAFSSESSVEEELKRESTAITILGYFSNVS